jgi:hypothetical protein
MVIANEVEKKAHQQRQRKAVHHNAMSCLDDSRRETQQRSCQAISAQFQPEERDKTATPAARARGVLTLMRHAR